VIYISTDNIIVLEAFFTDWMQCEIQKECLKNPPRQTPLKALLYIVIISLYGQGWDLFRYCRTNIARIKVCVYRKYGLSNEVVIIVGSHNCDTIGCISEHHLLTERGEVTMTRQWCHGIIVQIH
jgi:hypothetical protein